MVIVPSAEKLTWAAGLYYFREHQDVFLGIPQDYNTSIPYLEFNQGSTNGVSKSGYADATYAITPQWKVTAGARYSNESKDRTGFNFIANLNTNGVAVRTGTPGFSFAIAESFHFVIFPRNAAASTSPENFNSAFTFGML